MAVKVLEASCGKEGASQKPAASRTATATPARNNRPNIGITFRVMAPRPYFFTITGNAVIQLKKTSP
jgi:hypothetical protein